MHSSAYSQSANIQTFNCSQSQFSGSSLPYSPPLVTNMPIGGFPQNSQYSGPPSVRPFIPQNNVPSLSFPPVPLQNSVEMLHHTGPVPHIQNPTVPGQQYRFMQPFNPSSQFTRPPPFIPCTSNSQTFANSSQSGAPLQVSTNSVWNGQSQPPSTNSNSFIPAGFPPPLVSSTLNSSFPQHFANSVQNSSYALFGVGSTVPLAFPTETSKPSNVPTCSYNTHGYTNIAVSSDPEELLLKALMKKFEEATIKPSTKENVPISVAEYSAVSKQAFAILQELEQKKGELELLIHSESKPWNNKVKGIVKKQVLLCSLLEKLSDTNNKNAVRLKLKKIKKKRASINHQKKERAKLEAEKKEARAKAHAEIDRFHDGLREKDQKKKREAEMKKEADCILSEVRKKIQEAKLNLKKLKVMEKCRRASKEHVTKKGVLILPTHDRNFDTKLSKMRALILAQLSHYEDEERAMKVMLETEQEGQLEVEVQWKVKKLKMLQEKRHSKILTSLFGLSEPPTQDDPLFLFHQFYDAGNKSIEKLVEIRRSWDMYLVPQHSSEGSNVPQQWVVPCQPSSEAWASALEQ